MADAATWGQLHAGDTVRLGDGRAWRIVERGPAMDWVVGGASAGFAFERVHEQGWTTGGRGRVTAVRKLAESAPVIGREDHGPVGEAVQNIIDQGLGVQLVKEDQFSAPAQTPATIKRDRWGRYLLPDPRTGEGRSWTRATTLARTLSDEYGLTQWKMRGVAKGMSMRSDLQAGAAAADPDRDKKTLDSIAAQALDAAGSKSGSNLGTAFHQIAERYDRGEVSPGEVQPPLRGLLDTYINLLHTRRLAVVPAFIEQVVVCPEFGCAGTLDRVVQLPSGAYAVADLKSAKNVTYSWLEISMQLAIYANATHIWNTQTGQYYPMPDQIDTDVAIVIHVPSSGDAVPGVHQVDIASGFEHCRRARGVRAARNGAKALAKPFEWKSIEAVKSDEDVALELVAAAGSQAELASLWDRFQATGAWTERVNAAAFARAKDVTP